MKIRMDFVTNSSSSSFILARKPTLNEAQKEGIIRYVEKHFLGDVTLSPDSTKEQRKAWIEDEWIEDEIKEKALSALENGCSVYSGYVNYEGADDNYAAVFEDIWRIMEENADSKEDFVAIDDDLSY